MNIEQMPVFNEFVWENYDTEKIKNEYLYIVEVSKFNLLSIRKSIYVMGIFSKSL